MPRRFDAAKVNKLVVSTYKLVGFAVLTLIALALVSYLGANVFYWFSTSWIEPTVIAPTDERVLALSTQLLQQSSARDKVAADLADAERVMRMQQEFLEGANKALADELADRKSELNHLMALDRSFASTRAEVASSGRVYSGLSKRRLAAEYGAHLIDREAAATGALQLSQIAQGNLSLAEKAVELNTRRAELSRETETLAAAVGQKPASRHSIEVLKTVQDVRRAEVELAKAKDNHGVLQRSLRALRPDGAHDRRVALLARRRRQGRDRVRAVRQPRSHQGGRAGLRLRHRAALLQEGGLDRRAVAGRDGLQASAAQHTGARPARRAVARRHARRRAQGAVRRRQAGPVLMRAAAILALVSLASTARAADGYSDVSDAYCTFAQSVAKSESAVLLSPQLFLDYGIVNGNDVTTGAGGVTSAPPVERLTFGARYSLVAGLVRGVVNRQRAAADCERYRAESGLSRFLVENREQVSPAALDAKLAVLRAALPRARDVLRNLRGSVERAHATVEELEATQVRVDDLEAAVMEAETLRAGLPSRSALPSPEELLRRHREADEEVGKYEARLRLTEAFDISVRAGYDRFFGLRDQLPLFGVVSFTLSPAIVYMPSLESDAARARARVLRAENDSVEQKAELLASRLRALYASECRRLGEVRVLLADVEGRIHAIEAIESDKLRRFRESMWFDWVKLKAEQEFLRVHVAELQMTLGGGGGDGG